MAKLIAITGKAISGEWGSDDIDSTGIPVLRTTNFTNEGYVNYSDVVTRTITKKNIAEKMLRRGDIIIEKSGGSDKQPVGRVIFFEGEEEKYLFNNFTGLLRVKDTEKWLPKYVFYAMYANYISGGTVRFENRTTGLHNLQTDNYIAALEIPDYSIAEQTDIVSRLDNIWYLVSLQRERLDVFDQLVKSRFIELFGDTVINPLSLPVSALEDTADIVSGITKGRKIHGATLYEVPYMAVSNVKAGYIDWRSVKTIEATAAEIEQYRLLPMDVLMTEGGDPDKLGRGAIINNPPQNCIHQNHVFRVRVNREMLLPAYLEEYLQHQKAKQYFLRCAKQTTGIASVNMKQLRALPLLLPPMALQEQFSAFVEQTDKSKLYGDLEVAA